jgi:hypothetical protein
LSLRDISADHCGDPPGSKRNEGVINDVVSFQDRTSFGEIRVLHLYGTLDAGCAVNPGLVESQITGMMVQATSRILKEEVTAATSPAWIGIPIQSFVSTNVRRSRRSSFNA